MERNTKKSKESKVKKQDQEDGGKQIPTNVISMLKKKQILLA
jgi:hypothetical protein